MNEPDICRSIHELIMLHLPEILSLRNTSELKSDHTFVSKGDKLCEKLIFDFLDSNLKDYLVISEETETNLSRLEEVEYVITVDPIDGTENFVSGLKEWGVGISVYKGMRHYQSMIMLPELGIRLCTGDQFSKIIGSRICGLSSFICNLKILRGWNRALNIVLWGVACIICIMLYEAVTDSFYI